MGLKKFETKIENKVTQDMVAQDKHILSLVSDWSRLNSAQRKHFEAKRRFVDKFDAGLITHWHEFWVR